MTQVRAGVVGGVAARFDDRLAQDVAAVERERGGQQMPVVGDEAWKMWERINSQAL
jgi:hypothetical protein